MQEKLRLIRVFIGSPGGLEEERQAAHAVVKEINQHNSDHWGSLFKLMGWEEAIPGDLSPKFPPPHGESLGLV